MNATAQQPVRRQRHDAGERPFIVIWESTRACPLASTGPNRTLPLVGVGLSSFTLGVLVLLAFAYQGRHARPEGRHLAAPYRGRFL